MYRRFSSFESSSEKGDGTPFGSWEFSYKILLSLSAQYTAMKRRPEALARGHRTGNCPSYNAYSIVNSGNVENRVCYQFTSVYSHSEVCHLAAMTHDHSGSHRVE
jgi:hypothetical protein